MIDVYSKRVPGVLLHKVVRASDFKEERIDLASPEEFIQCSALNIKKGKTFRPHRHIFKEGPMNIIAQESWCVIKGKVRVFFYDIRGEFLEHHDLEAGDASFTFQGGHTYEVLEDAIVYEYKTGPYTGQKNDKVFIDDL